MPPAVQSLDHLVLTVSDIAASVTFYRTVLGMAAQVFEASDGSRRHALSFGNQKINLHEAGREFEPKAQHPGPGTADLCFLGDSPLDRWQAHLAACDIPVESGPVPRSGAAGPLMSLYIRDPDGNLIEISTLRDRAP